jgi:hypothetical protein
MKYVSMLKTQTTTLFVIIEEVRCFGYSKGKKKGKAIPVTGHGGP